MGLYCFLVVFPESQKWRGGNALVGEQLGQKIHDEVVLVEQHVEQKRR